MEKVSGKSPESFPEILPIWVKQNIFRMASNYVGKSIPGFPQRADDFPDSLQGVEAACVESRMAADTMNSEERAAFPQYNSPNKKKEYLYIRKRFR